MRVNEIVRSLNRFKEETTTLEFVNLLIMETVESNLEDHEKIDEIEKVIYLFDHYDVKRLSKFQPKKGHSTETVKKRKRETKTRAGEDVDIDQLFSSLEEKNVKESEKI